MSKTIHWIGERQWDGDRWSYTEHGTALEGDDNHRTTVDGGSRIWL